jgi:hypothetical protein
MDGAYLTSGLRLTEPDLRTITYNAVNHWTLAPKLPLSMSAYQRRWEHCAQEFRKLPYYRNNKRRLLAGSDDDGEEQAE